MPAALLRFHGSGGAAARAVVVREREASRWVETQRDAGRNDHAAWRRRRAIKPPAPSASRAKLLGSGTADHSGIPVLAEVRPVGAVVLASSKMRRWICSEAATEPAKPSTSRNPEVTPLLLIAASLNEKGTSARELPGPILTLPRLTTLLRRAYPYVATLATKSFTYPGPACDINDKSVNRSPVKSPTKLVAPELRLTRLLSNVICTVAPLAADAPAMASAPTAKRGNSVDPCLFIFVFMFLYCSYFDVLVLRTPPRRLGEE